MAKVILVTGAPGVGKSTLCRALEARIASLVRVDYGSLLLLRKQREGVELNYEQLREQSASVISSADVVTTDDMVVREIGHLRSTSDVIIDSHALTREAYGFRAVPFSFAHLRDLRLDGIVVLHCNPEMLVRRVKADPRGRRSLSVELAREIQVLQESLSLTYATASGCTLHAIDTTHLTTQGVLAIGLEILAKLEITPG